MKPIILSDFVFSKRKRASLETPSFNLNLIVDRPDGLIKKGKKNLAGLIV